MLAIVMKQAKQRNNVILFLALFVLFLGLYIFLDFEGNTNYTVMTDNFGIGIVLLHILINIIIGVLSSIMVTFSIINYRLTKVEPTGSNAIPFITFIFGVLTFGCTSCVVAFLSAVGIAFTPIVLPSGNLIWKLVALGFVTLGFMWIMYSIQHTKCKIKKV
ncbi:MAG: hypothetical protein JXR62_04240 [Bacilli bacterium]|nr:hypothetical protein [Bacilli bacterium]